ncbi:MAG: class I SAM-dependent RNA methyltransferase [Bacteroidales bacterium]
MSRRSIELVIEKPAAGGRMIARLDGQIVLVAGTLPGERVRAYVERVSKGVIYATTTEVLEASPDRRAVTGDWMCGGNVYAHVAYPRQVEIKGEIIADAFARIARLPLPDSLTERGRVPANGSEEAGYRMRARLHVRGARIGFFREGTHDLCDPRQTAQLLSGTADVLEELAAALVRHNIGTVQSLELAENIPGDQRALHLEVSLPADLAALADAAAGRVTGISYSGPFSRLSSSVSGSPVVKDRLAFDSAGVGHTMLLQRNVRSFFQGNRYLLPALLTRVIGMIDDGPVVDLYAGVGLFGVALAAAGRREVVAVEGDRTSAQDLKVNAAPYGDAIEARHEAVETFMARPAAFQDATLVVDPPRTGMSREALAAIAGAGARSIVYVSCDVATLARDVRRLVDAGYLVEHVEGFDLFPNTAHVEVVVKLRKAGA